MRGKRAKLLKKQAIKMATKAPKYSYIQRAYKTTVRHADGTVMAIYRMLKKRHTRHASDTTQK